MILALVIMLFFVLDPFNKNNNINTEDNNTKENIGITDNNSVVEKIEKIKSAEYTDKKFIVENLQISCEIFSSDFDGDGSLDGIYYYIRLSNSSNRVIPAEGYFTTEFFYTIPIRGGRSKGGIIDYIQTEEIKGNDRFKYFNSDRGYMIKLKWDDFGDRLDLIREGILTNQVVLKTIFTTKEGTIVKDETGQYKNSLCTISEDYLEGTEIL